MDASHFVRHSKFILKKFIKCWFSSLRVVAVYGKFIGHWKNDFYNLHSFLCWTGFQLTTDFNNKISSVTINRFWFKDTKILLQDLERLCSAWYFGQISFIFFELSIDIGLILYIFSYFDWTSWLDCNRKCVAWLNAFGELSQRMQLLLTICK